MKVKADCVAVCSNMLRHDEAKYAGQSYLIASSDSVTEAGDMMEFVGPSYLMSMDKKGVWFISS